MVRAVACLSRRSPHSSSASSLAGLAAAVLLGLAVSSCSLMKDRVEQASVDPPPHCLLGKEPPRQPRGAPRRKTAEEAPFDFTRGFTA